MTDKVIPDKAAHTFGKPRGNEQNDPGNFLRRGARSTSVPSLREMKQRNPEVLRPTKLKPLSRPSIVQGDKPVFNLVSSKNFIVSNAVEAILSAPKQVTESRKDYMKKEDYGKVPKYLKQINKDIEAEYDFIRQLNQEGKDACNSNVRPLAEDERLHIIEGLKAKWERANHEYQAFTHLTHLDTVGKRLRKEKRDAEFHQLEQDIEKLSKASILVDASC
eukprot:CAMPEP_0117512130 /NCGR_PEP_ID=MMETSP0784-20121206/28873_1 /TAXON_ID=39447 /ORGANISM="" /LENGTH=218 /DNA_ID=CAMNT_0005307841 /DNA_START=182 /DNA_END=838 /DNA_ORIENTATION=+